MAASTSIATTTTQREQHVAEALHSGEIEGLVVTPAGRIDSDELVARALYGLD